MTVTSPSNSGIFRTRFGISLRLGDVSLRDDYPMKYADIEMVADKLMVCCPC